MVELKDTDYAEEVAERDEVSIIASKPIIRIVTIDSFELWCWKRLLRAPWTARRSNQSILKEINPKYSLEKTLMLGKIEGKRRRGWQRLGSTTDSMDMSLSKLQEIVKDRGAWRAAVHGVAKSWTQLSD